jgi:hypothetical protein
MRSRTDFAWGIGHGSHDLCGRSYHLGELADGHTGKDADEKLVLQSFLHSRFAQDSVGKLWFTTEGENQPVCDSGGIFE